MGRDIGWLRQLSSKSGMPIVAGGGFYTQPFYPREIGSMSEDQVFRRAHGAGGGRSYRCIRRDRVVGLHHEGRAQGVRAIGRAHLATNIPIFTHTGIPGKSALEQLDILEDVGVDPKHVVIGHLTNLVDPNTEVHRAICRRGCVHRLRSSGRAERRSGGADRHVADRCGLRRPSSIFVRLLNANQLKRNNKELGYAKTLTVFVPKLKKAGASDEVLRQIMNDNPRRFLAFVPKVKRKA